jgi:TusA-related sulfurtransferase
MKFNDEPFPIDLDAPKYVPCSGERCPLTSITLKKRRNV